MKNRDHQRIIIILGLIVFSLCIIFFFREHGKHDCKIVVKMKGKEPMKANLVNYYKAGVVDVIDCKGQHIVYPTTQIETITEEP